MILRLALGLTLLCTGCSAADTSDAGVDAGTLDAGVDAGVAWVWPEDAVSVTLRESPAVQQTTCQGWWRVSFGSAEFSYDETCPGNRRMNSRILSSAELESVLRSLRSLRPTTEPCTGTDGPTLFLTVARPSSEEVLGTRFNCLPDQIEVELAATYQLLHSMMN